MAPVWNESAKERGAVCEGPVGARWLGRYRVFRYEVRCWRGGRIPDIAEAVQSPQRVSSDPARAAAVLKILSSVPSLTWGRDELGSGDMWNSNSLVSWLLARSGHDMASIQPPAGGRAPGWLAGLALASRQESVVDRAHPVLGRDGRNLAIAVRPDACVSGIELAHVVRPVEQLRQEVARRRGRGSATIAGRPR
jgi:hypothetical protein